MAVDDDSSAGLETTRASHLSTSASTPIDSSNIGFQLLKKQGWKEGTGLGASEQGRLEPIATIVKKNKRGLGAEKAYKEIKQSKDKDKGDPKLPKIKVKGVSKKMRKIQKLEKKMQEKEFDRDFFRMFWPDNGSECEYRHSDIARVNQRDCWYWLHGSCLNPKCAFRHRPLEELGGPASNVPNAFTKPAVACVFFQKGHCLKGDWCPFLHAPNTKAIPVPVTVRPWHIYVREEF
ncbi:uncharacterized protein LOC130996291 [Salvia miltiorrhiza]|uniref:uncharacterized protein LOC130996291 n=1 Tax=Salvia miltiorrhiza TaxID=226208 RepID=UPI0025ACF67A|nr:uncharacterized protein LOC130996291 [Salvia miltiorrhiza]